MQVSAHESDVELKYEVGDYYLMSSRTSRLRGHSADGCMLVSLYDAKITLLGRVYLFKHVVRSTDTAVLCIRCNNISIVLAALCNDLCMYIAAYIAYRR